MEQPRLTERSEAGRMPALPARQRRQPGRRNDEAAKVEGTLRQDAGAPSRMPLPARQNPMRRMTKRGKSRITSMIQRHIGGA